MAKLIYKDEEHGEEISIQCSGQEDIHAFLNLWERLAMAITYHPKNVKEAIIERAEELEEERKDDKS
jgi:hypothetical protein